MKRPSPSGPPWAEMGELLDGVISVSGTPALLRPPSPRVCLANLGIPPLPKHTQTPLFPGPQACPASGFPPFCANEGIRGF